MKCGGVLVEDLQEYIFNGDLFLWPIYSNEKVYNITHNTKENVPFKVDNS